MASTVVGNYLGGSVGRIGQSLGQLGRLLPGISIRVGWGVGLKDILLRAVPKKKTSHQKKRQRQLTGRKQINPLNNLNRCPACGNYKRAHTLCMRCVSQIQRIWKTRDQDRRPQSQYQENLHPIDKRILYPGRHVKEDEKTLKKKDYLYTRPKTLPVEPKQKPQKVQRPRD